MIIKGAYFKDDQIQVVQHINGRLFVRTIDGNDVMFQSVPWDEAERIIYAVENMNHIGQQGTEQR